MIPAASSTRTNWLDSQPISFLKNDYCVCVAGGILYYSQPFHFQLLLVICYVC
jgi:hypothetical protein